MDHERNYKISSNPKPQDNRFTNFLPYTIRYGYLGVMHLINKVA